jgi:hypothetical protein
LGPSHRHPLPTEGQPSPAHQARGGSCQPGGLHTSRAVAARQVTRARRGRFPRRRAGRGASSDGQSECCLRLKSVSAPWHPRLVRLFLANGDVNFLVGPCALHGDAHEHWTDCRRLTRCCKCYCCRLRRFAAHPPTALPKAASHCTSFFVSSLRVCLRNSAAAPPQPPLADTLGWR